MKRLLAFSLSLSLFVAAPAFSAEIIVSGAASLTNAFTSIAETFSAASGIQVHTNFAASNPLLQQMREGAPVDVFASADQATMDAAQADNLIDPATRRDFVANSLVLIVPKGGNSPVKSVEDLSQAKLIAVGHPDSVPAGRYARDSLSSLNLWESLSPKFIMGESVRQVLDYVSRGEVDAGFVYATDAYISADTVEIIATVGGHEPILYPVAVAVASQDKASAQAFVDFLLSPEGQAILAAYGFSPAD